MLCIWALVLLFGNTALATVNLGRTNVTLDTMVFNNDAALKVVYCKTSEIKAEVNKMIGAARKRCGCTVGRRSI